MFVMISEDVPFVLKAGYVKVYLSPTGLIRSTISILEPRTEYINAFSKICQENTSRL